METVESWGDAVMVSVTEALQNFLGFLPALVGALLILILGWIISGLLAGLVERGLKTIGFERAAQSTGISGFIQRSGSSWTASAIVAEIVKWFIRLLAIQAAASVLGLTQISQIVNAIMLWLPNLVVAIVIVVIGALIAKFVSGLVRGSTSQMGFTNPDLLASIAYYAIVVFAVMAAVDQLGIAETVVNTIFIGLVAMVVLAAGLAFGLGGQQTAAQITAGWYASGRQAGARIAEYAQSHSQEQARMEEAGLSATATSTPSETPATRSRPASTTEPSRG
jgi:Conserved TM helix